MSCPCLLPRWGRHQSVARLTLLLAVLLSGPWSNFPLRAEKYLSIEEAQKLCFPGADRFEHRLVRFSRAQLDTLSERLGAKPLNRGNQTWLAIAGNRYLGVLLFDQVPGKYELIDYVIAIDPDGRITALEIIEYRESHGAEIRNEKWRAQFKFRSRADRLRFNDDIYNISGATVSCRAVTDGVRRILATYELVLRPRLIADGWLSESGGTEPGDGKE